MSDTIPMNEIDLKYLNLVLLGAIAPPELDTAGARLVMAAARAALDDDQLAAFVRWLAGRGIAPAVKSLVRDLFVSGLAEAE